jgi:hypothetical protein
VADESNLFFLFFYEDKSTSPNIKNIAGCERVNHFYQQDMMPCSDKWIRASWYLFRIDTNRTLVYVQRRILKGIQFIVGVDKMKIKAKC